MYLIDYQQLDRITKKNSKQYCRKIQKIFVADVVAFAVVVFVAVIEYFVVNVDDGDADPD